MIIENSIALVTGANKGIGRELVNALLTHGAKKIYAAGRDAKSLEPVTAIDPTRVVPLVLDITKMAEIDNAMKSAPDVTLLINNAGVATSFNVLTSPEDSFHRDMEVNYFGTLQVIRKFVPILEENGGSLVNVISIVALASAPGMSGYSASKAALHSVTQSLRVELGKKGVKVHAIFPGIIDTDMAKGLDIPKTAPKVVAENVLAGVAKGDEDIFPDPMSEQLQHLRLKDLKEFERRLGTF